MRSFLVLTALAAFAAIAPAQVVLTQGHIDLGLGYAAGSWDPHVHDEDNAAEYEPGDAIIRYTDAARFVRPAGANFDFIGAPAGATIWRNFQSSQPNIPWLGFGFEEIAPGTFTSYTESDERVDPILSEWVTVSLVGAVMPAGGQFSVWQGTGSSRTLWMATSDGITATDKFISTPGGHEHASFAFTAAGTYELTFVASALGPSGTLTSSPYTYTFQAVPEPASMAVLGLGLAAFRKRRRK